MEINATDGLLICCRATAASKHGVISFLRGATLALVQKVDDTMRRRSPLGSLRGTPTGSTLVRS